MTLILRNHEVRGLMPLSGYIEAVEEGYRQVGLGQGAGLPRHNIWLQGDRSQTVDGGHMPPGARGSFKLKAALLPGIGFAGVQAYTAGLGRGLSTYLFLFDTVSGDLAALIEVLYYDWLKTAAVAALATRHLAPSGSEVVALFGTGRHARSQLHGLCTVLPIRRVQAYSRDADKRADFCRRLSDELHIPVVPAASPAEALRGAHIVTTITTSPCPVFDGRLLEARPLHINAMGAHYPWVREIDTHVVQGCRIILDLRNQAEAEKGEILIPVNAGELSATYLAGDLGEVISGKIPGRTSDTPWTLFLSGGTGIEDVAVGARLYQQALAAGVGSKIELDQPYDFEF